MLNVVVAVAAVLMLQYQARYIIHDASIFFSRAPDRDKESLTTGTGILGSFRGPSQVRILSQ